MYTNDVGYIGDLPTRVIYTNQGYLYQPGLFILMILYVHLSIYLSTYLYLYIYIHIYIYIYIYIYINDFGGLTNQSDSTCPKGDPASCGLSYIWLSD